MTATTAADYRPIPMSEPTSRLHAAANALAGWDHNTGSSEDISGVPGVLPEHWDGAQQVWDALQPKYTQAVELAALKPGDAIVKHTREGVYVWVRSPHRYLWKPVVARSVGVVGSPVGGATILDEFGSVRLLWSGQ